VTSLPKSLAHVLHEPWVARFQEWTTELWNSGALHGTKLTDKLGPRNGKSGDVDSAASTDRYLAAAEKDGWIVRGKMELTRTRAAMSRGHSGAGYPIDHCWMPNRGSSALFDFCFPEMPAARRAECAKHYGWVATIPVAIETPADLYPIHDGCNGSLMPASKGTDKNWLICCSCKEHVLPSSREWSQARAAHEAAGLTDFVRIGRPMAAAIVPKDLTGPERTALRAIAAGKHASDEPAVSLVNLGLATQKTSFVASKIRTIRDVTPQGARVAKLLEAMALEKKIEPEPLFDMALHAPVDPSVPKRRARR
jgi:hypothetical protein